MARKRGSLKYSSNLLNWIADDLFSGGMKKKQDSDSDGTEHQDVQKSSVGGGGLFDDEDDLFSVAPAKKTEPKKGGSLTHYNRQNTHTHTARTLNNFCLSVAT